MHRRAIIKKLFLGASLSLWGGGLLATARKSSVMANMAQNPPLNLFTKVLQWVPLEDLPKTVQDMGFSGIDIAVRANGHFHVNEIKEKLPGLVAGSQALGMNSPILTTELTGENMREMEEFLRVVSGEGLRHYRMGWLKYQSKDVMSELKAFNGRLKKLAEMNQKYGVQGHYQNHTGNGVGGSVWELLYLLEGIDPQHIGIQYDLRHAMVEGYKSWETGFQVIKDKITTLDIKDFKWKNSSGKDMPVTVPLGKGNVDLNKLSRTAAFKSSEIPKILHIEYDLGGAEHGSKDPTASPKEIFSAIRLDVEYYKNLTKA